MSLFRHRLAAINPAPGGRRWLYVPYDQLSGAFGPLSRHAPSELAILLVESTWKPAQRRYHKQKLALVLANMRHFALEQASRGVHVAHVVSDHPYPDVLREHARGHGVMTVMEPAERELRVALSPLAADGTLEVIPHEGWLTTERQFDASLDAAGRWRMDRFYRLVRDQTGVLMDGERPVGGKYSFDTDNRKPWRGRPPAPEPPRFRPDDVTTEVVELVSQRFADHPGELDASTLPATAADAESLWAWAQRACMPHFGPFEDAMSVRSTGLFHTRISSLLNLHRLLPRRVIADACQLDIALASKEGFVRQILGWREFMRHIHRTTDGFRSEAFAESNHLQAATPLPPAFWGQPSGLACLDRVVADVWREGYGHHITRLMILGNLATLLGLSPRELSDWFWVAYTDAYDWVVEPNVLGMASFALGDRLTTKPYVSGAAYIDRMSDYCGTCAFDPKRNCPITGLYWAFLERQRDVLGTLPRLRMPLASLRKRSEAQRHADGRVFDKTVASLAAGVVLTPADFDD